MAVNLGNEEAQEYLDKLNGVETKSEWGEL